MKGGGGKENEGRKEGRNMKGGREEGGKLQGVSE
jgi:hypothetical protein